MKTKLLNKIILALATIFALTAWMNVAHAQNVNIPDANFKAALVGNAAINTNLDGEIQVTEANTYSGSINVNSSGINDLTGIEAFWNLSSLSCAYNNLVSLDLSFNSDLNFINCSGNQIPSLNLANFYHLSSLICFDNQLTSLNLSSDTMLTTLSCSNNHLTNLSLSSNTRLTILGIQQNNLTSLVLFNNTDLTTLYCYSNQLTNLDISHNTLLTYLDCEINQLISLNVSSNTALTTLIANNNNITSLDVSANTALTTLEIQYNQLTSLNMQNGNNINISTFDAISNLYLHCIQVDNVTFANTNWSSYKDSWASFSENPPVPVSVFIMASSTTLCSGTAVTYTATPTNGGTTPSYQWQVNGMNVGSNSSTYFNYPLNGDQVQCILTSNEACTTGNPASSNFIIMTVIPSMPVSVIINANPGTNICTGTSVTYTATPVNGGASPTYQWQVNGGNVGSNSSYYVDLALANNDQVRCIMTSNDICTIGNPATSNTITMTVNPVLPVSIAITPSANPVCTGTMVFFTAIATNGGSTPAYQWKLNGFNIGAIASTYAYMPTMGDNVSCQLTSNIPCPLGNPAISNSITMTVNPVLIPTVTISADPGSPICDGTVVSLTATATNGGATPTYAWYANGAYLGAGSNFIYVPANNDNVQCVLTSSIVCAVNNPTTSNTLVMSVLQLTPVSVDITVFPGTTVCQASNVTFTATPQNGGTSPFYQWKLNGFDVGYNSPSWTYAGPINNDQVECVVTSSEACASGNPSTSNTLTMNVEFPMPAGVFITAVPGSTICPGTDITFTATPMYGGTNPMYDWQLNGISVGYNSPIWSSPALINGDQVQCIMWSNETCISNYPANSNIMIVSVDVPPFVSAGTYSPVCNDASPVALNGTPPGGVFTGDGVINGFFDPLAAGQGLHAVTYTYFDGICIDTAMSNVLVTPAPDVDAGPNVTLECGDSTAMLIGYSSFGVTYQWHAEDTTAVYWNANTPTLTIATPGKYTLNVTDTTTGCSASDTVRVFRNPCILPYYPPPVNGKDTVLIGPELTQLSQNSQSMDSVENIITRDGNDVYIEVIVKQGMVSAARNLLLSLGLTDSIQNENLSLTFSGKFPIGNLQSLNQYPDLFDYARPMYPPVLSRGVAYTLGDAAQHSDIGRSAFGLDGQGVKVGVLSDSYNTLPGQPALADVANGDLPAAGNPDGEPTQIELLKDYPYGRGTDEGRAMLQIIHDIAPKSALAFRTGILTPENFAVGIKELQAAGCNVICDDITYITEPFFKDGVISRAVNYVTELGVSYFTAAGNYDMQSYESTFLPAPAPNGITGMAHDFGGGDIFQSVTLAPGSYTIVLQWDDDFYSLPGSTSGAANDFDIYLTDDNGKTRIGFNRVNTGNDPYEVLPIVVKSTTNTNIMIVRASGTANARLKYIVFRGNLKQNEYLTGTSTIIGQANSTGAMTVGAANYSFVDPVTRDCQVTPVYTATFSSKGGTLINNWDRKKPDFVAPNGFNTTVNFGSPNCDNDAFPNFYGTSAASPHAAAVGALVQQARMKFYNELYTPLQMRSLLQNTAVDLDAPGYDVNSGYGLINAYAAISTFATPTPALISLDVPAGITPGIAAFTLTATGKYFTPQSVIYFRDISLATTYIDENHLTAVVPDFTGNPPVKIYTPPISTSLLDGGFSNILYFSSVVRKEVVITADNKTKKFGEQLPTFTSTVTVNGQSLQDAGLTLTDLGLNDIQYTLTFGTNSMSNTGIYYINPSAGTIAPELDELYHYTFNNTDNYHPGLLTIEKMPLQIVPVDDTLYYGDKINGRQFHYNYIYDYTNIALADRAAFLTALRNIYEPSIAKEVALIDDRDEYNNASLSQSDLANLAFISGSRGVVNGSRGVVNGSRGIVNGTFPDTTYVVDITYKSLANYNLDGSAADLDDDILLMNGSRGIANGSRGIVNSESLVDGTALINGSRGIANGSRAIANGSRGVVNGEELDGVSNTNTAVIIHETDLDVPENPDSVFQLLSISAITGMTAGVHWIVPGGFLSANFDVSYGLGHLHINPYAIKVTAHDTTTEYGTPPAYTSVISGYQYDDIMSGVFAGNIAYAPLASSQINVGNHTIVASGLSLIQPSNYVLSYVNGNINVTHATLIATADNKSRGYGFLNPPLTITYSGFKFSDNTNVISPAITASTFATYSSAPGNYPITLSSGSTAANYFINPVNGTLTVGEAPTCSINTPSSTPSCGSTGNILTASAPAGYTYSWSVSGPGWQITNGNGTLAITYTAGISGTTGVFVLTLSAPTTNFVVSTCNKSITVIDNVPPVALCKNISVYLDATGNGSTTASAVNNGSNDACGIAGMVLSQTTFNCSQVGANTATLTVTDVNGNISTCNTIITVIDNQLPAITCPSNLTVTANATGCTATITSLGTPVKSDNCSMTVSNNAPVAFPLGISTITWKVTDVAGNSATCSQTVTVNPGPGVVVSASSTTVCSGSPSTLTATGCASYIWSSSLGTGCSKVVSPTLATTYTVTGTNTYGCISTASVSIAVNPLPGAPANFSGVSSVLRGGTYVYSINSITNADSYIWAYSGTGATIVQGSTGNVVTITYSCNATNGNLTVKGHNGCGNGQVATTAITTNPGSTINIYCSKLTVGEGRHPTTVKTPIMPLNVTGSNLGFKVFKSNQIGISAKMKNFDNIWHGSCAGVQGYCSYNPNSNVTASVTVTGPTLVYYGGGPSYKYVMTVPAGKRYLVIAKEPADESACAVSTNDGSDPPCYVYPGKRTLNKKNHHDQCADDDDGDDDGDNDANFCSNCAKDMYLQVIENANGKIAPANTDAIPGSMLLIASPSFISFTDTVELLPIVYESVEGFWDVATTATPPEGFFTVDTLLSTDVNTDNINTLQFTLIDTGSVWTATEVISNLKHNGKNIVHVASPRMIDNKTTKDYLDQNYPNPFFGSTTIPYTFPVDCKVRLSVFDVFGREVCVLIDKSQVSGEYRQHWTAAIDLAAGIYVVRLQATSLESGKSVINGKSMIYIK